MKKEKSVIKKDIFVRVNVLYFCFVVVALCVVARLIYVQLFSSEIRQNAERLEGRIFSENVIFARRGNILSRDGEPLATSLFRYQAEVDFSSPGFDSLELFNEQSDSLAKLLSAFFKDRTPKEYALMMRQNRAAHRRIVYRGDSAVYRSEGWFGRLIDRLRGEEMKTIKLYDTLRDHRPVPLFPRDVDFAEWEQLRSYPILNWNLGMTYNRVDKDQRVYPQGELARRTIGLSGDQGKYGIEEVMRQTLTGRDGKVVRQRIARGFYGRVVDQQNVEPEDGLDVVSTLDLELQDVVDKALRKQLEKQNAFWGTSVVMEVATGDIMAMANLTLTKNGTYAEVRNHALSGRMEPGSTFKLAALLALVEDRGLPLSKRVYTGNGSPVMVGNAKIRDSHSIPDADMRKAVAESSNVYFAQAIFDAYKNNPKAYTDFLAHLHLDRPMGLEEYGEAQPIFPTPDNRRLWTPYTTLPNVGYGYAIEITPIQTLTLYNAVANGGKMVAPRLIREIRAGEDVVERPEPKILVEHICSEESLRKVQECLEGVCRGRGTASGYFRDTTRFFVAGKTGTAKVAQGGIKYSDGYYLGTMVNYFPADKPRYTAITCIYTRIGRGTTIYGGGLAGPVQRDIIYYIYNRSQDNHRTFRPEGDVRPPQSIKGGNLKQVQTVAKRLKAPVTIDSDEGWGSEHNDSTGTTGRIAKITRQSGIAPNTVGMGLKDAIFVVESCGGRVTFSGKGVVRSQSVAPGSVIAKGTKIHLTLN